MSGRGSQEGNNGPDLNSIYRHRSLKSVRTRYIKMTVKEGWHNIWIEDTNLASALVFLAALSIACFVRG
jgi:hypothetical protein